MRRGLLLIAVAGIIIVGIVFSTLPASNGGIVWLTDYSDALVKAQEEDRRVMLYFYSTKYGSEACNKFEAEVFEDKDVISFVNSNFICVKINIDSEEECKRLPSKYKGVFIVPAVTWITSGEMALEGLVGGGFTEYFIEKAQAALLDPEETRPVTKSTQMLLTINETGWVKPDLYLSSVYEVKPGMTIQDVCLYEKASPSDWVTVRLLIKTCEQEGTLDYYINGEPLGLSYITEKVARGEEFASCCQPFPWMGGGGPPRENVQTVESIGYEGKFQFVFTVLIESPD